MCQNKAFKFGHFLTFQILKPFAKQQITIDFAKPFKLNLAWLLMHCRDAKTLSFSREFHNFWNILSFSGFCFQNEWPKMVTWKWHYCDCIWETNYSDIINIMYYVINSSGWCIIAENSFVNGKLQGSFRRLLMIKIGTFERGILLTFIFALKTSPLTLHSQLKVLLAFGLA